jgi:hypothetical protein
VAHNLSPIKFDEPEEELELTNGASSIIAVCPPVAEDENKAVAPTLLMTGLVAAICSVCNGVAGTVVGAA